MIVDKLLELLAAAVNGVLTLLTFNLTNNPALDSLSVGAQTFLGSLVSAHTILPLPVVGGCAALWAMTLVPATAVRTILWTLETIKP